VGGFPRASARTRRGLTFDREQAMEHIAKGTERQGPHGPLHGRHDTVQGLAVLHPLQHTGAGPQQTGQERRTAGGRGLTPRDGLGYRLNRRRHTPRPRERLPSGPRPRRWSRAGPIRRGSTPAVAPVVTADRMPPSPLRGPPHRTCLAEVGQRGYEGVPLRALGPSAPPSTPSGGCPEPLSTGSGKVLSSWQRARILHAASGFRRTRCCAPYPPS
jgi:hypothetical protein